MQKQIEDQNKLFRVFELPDNNPDAANEIEKVRPNIVMEKKTCLIRIYPNLVCSDDERRHFENPSLNGDWLGKLEWTINEIRNEAKTELDC